MQEKTRQANVWYPDEKVRPCRAPLRCMRLGRAAYLFVLFISYTHQITYLIDMMRLNLEFKTRTWRLTKYKKTFKGCDLVDWLTKHLKLSREDAVAFGEVRSCALACGDCTTRRLGHLC
jgi:hypothetical protein